MQAPSSTGADDDDDIMSSLSSMLGRSKPPCHCHPLAPTFHPASSCSQWQGGCWGHRLSCSHCCPHCCCPLILAPVIPSSPCLSCPCHCWCHPLHCLSHHPCLCCPVLFVIGLSWVIYPRHLLVALLILSHCSPFPPHEQLLTAVVGGAAVVVVAVVVGGLSSHCSITRA